MMRFPLFFFLTTLVVKSSSMSLHRYRREKGTIVPVHTFKDEQERIDNYAASPVEAFFGTGAHTHSLAMNTDIGGGPNYANVNVGGMVFNNEVVGTRTNVTHQEAISGVDGMGKETGIDWNKELNDYRKQIQDIGNANDPNHAPHPYYESPTHFFGQSPFEHDTDLEGGPMKTPTIYTGNFMGLNVGANVFPAAPQYQERHNVQGVNPYNSVDWKQQFEAAAPQHANLVANQNEFLGANQRLFNPNIAPTEVPTTTPQLDSNQLRQKPIGKPILVRRTQTKTTVTAEVKPNPFVSRLRQ